MGPARTPPALPRQYQPGSKDPLPQPAAKGGSDPRPAPPDQEDPCGSSKTLCFLEAFGAQIPVSSLWSHEGGHRPAAFTSLQLVPGARTTQGTNQPCNPTASSSYSWESWSSPPHYQESILATLQDEGDSALFPVSFQQALPWPPNLYITLTPTPRPLKSTSPCTFRGHQGSPGFGSWKGVWREDWRRCLARCIQRFGFQQYITQGQVTKTCQAGTQHFKVNLVLMKGAPEGLF